MCVCDVYVAESSRAWNGVCAMRVPTRWMRARISFARLWRQTLACLCIIIECVSVVRRRNGVLLTWNERERVAQWEIEILERCVFWLLCVTSCLRWLNMQQQHTSIDRDLMWVHGMSAEHHCHSPWLRVCVEARRTRCLIRCDSMQTSLNYHSALSGSYWQNLIIIQVPQSALQLRGELNTAMSSISDLQFMHLYAQINLFINFCGNAIYLRCGDASWSRLLWGNEHMGTRYSILWPNLHVRRCRRHCHKLYFPDEQYLWLEFVYLRLPYPHRLTNCRTTEKLIKFVNRNETRSFWNCRMRQPHRNPENIINYLSDSVRVRCRTFCAGIKWFHRFFRIKYSKCECDFLIALTASHHWQIQQSRTTKQRHYFIFQSALRKLNVLLAKVGDIAHCTSFMHMDREWDGGGKLINLEIISKYIHVWISGLQYANCVELWNRCLWLN